MSNPVIISTPVRLSSSGVLEMHHAGPYDGKAMCVFNFTGRMNDVPTPHYAMTLEDLTLFLQELTSQAEQLLKILQERKQEVGDVEG